LLLPRLSFLEAEAECQSAITLTAPNHLIARVLPLDRALHVALLCTSGHICDATTDVA